jgi:hypothetical protein
MLKRAAAASQSRQWEKVAAKLQLHPAEWVSVYGYFGRIFRGRTVIEVA